MSTITGRTFLQPQAALLTAGVITAIPVDTATKFRGGLAVIASVLRQHPEAVPGWSMVSEPCSAPFAVEHATGRQIPLYFGVALGTVHVDACIPVVDAIDDVVGPCIWGHWTKPGVWLWPGEDEDPVEITGRIGLDLEGVIPGRSVLLCSNPVRLTTPVAAPGHGMWRSVQMATTSISELART